MIIALSLLTLIALAGMMICANAIQEGKHISQASAGAIICAVVIAICILTIGVVDWYPMF